MPNPEVCRRCAHAVPWTSLWGNLSLAIYKVVVGLIGGSAALVADAAHSFSDVIGSTGILVATRVSSKQPNERFPYGTGKAEFLGAVFVYTLLFFIAGGIIYHAIRKMLHPELAAPHFATLLGAVVSVVYNYIMFRYSSCVGMRNNSPAILADAFENKADAVASGACIAGILGAMFVHPICDPIAALGVGGVIVWNSQQQIREAAHGLLDTGLGREEVEHIERFALQQEGVRGVRFVRTRRTGARYWMDIGVDVPNDLDVAKVDEIVVKIRDELKRNPLCHHVDVFAFPEARAHSKKVASAKA